MPPQLSLSSTVFYFYSVQISNLGASRADVLIAAITSFPWLAGYYPLFAYLNC